MTMVSLQPISKGQQIFNDYGQLPRSDLLVSRGFRVKSLSAQLSILSRETSIETTLLAEPEGPSQEDMLTPRT